MSNAIEHIELLEPKSHVRSRLISCMRQAKITNMDDAANWLSSGEAHKFPNMGAGSIDLLKTVLDKLKPIDAQPRNSEPEVPTFQVVATFFHCGIDSHRHAHKNSAVNCMKKQAQAANKVDRNSRVFLIVRKRIDGSSMAAIGRELGLSSCRVSQILKRAERQVRTEATRAGLNLENCDWLDNHDYWHDDKSNAAPIGADAALGLLEQHLNKLR